MSYARTAVTRMTLDMSRPDLQRSETVTLGDTNRRWEVTLINGGAPFCLPPDWTAALTGIKPDGEGLLNGCSVVDGKIIYDFAAGQEIATCAGNYPVQFDIWDEVGELVASPKLYVNVLADVRPRAELESNGQYTIIGDLIGRVNQTDEDVDLLAETVLAQGTDITALKEKITTAGTITIPTTEWTDSLPKLAYPAQPVVTKGQVALLMPHDNTDQIAARNARIYIHPQLTGAGTVVVQRDDDGTAPTIDITLDYMILRVDDPEATPKAFIIGVDAYGEGGGTASGVDEEAVKALIDKEVPEWARAKQKPTYTPEEVKARPATWTPTAEEIGARPSTWMPTAEEVGARPSTWTPTAEEVGARPNTWTPTAVEVGADSEGTAADEVKYHNEDGGSHVDIRLDVTTLRTMIETVIGTDTGKSMRAVAALVVAEIVGDASDSFDTLEEIAAWIEAHPNDVAAMVKRITDLEAAMGGKVSKTDIINTLDSTALDKPLSAAMGKQLAGAISQINETLAGKTNAQQVSDAITAALKDYLTTTKAAELYQPAGDYPTTTDMDEAISAATKDLAPKSSIPTVPNKLPNPHALNINGKTYDGSSDVTVTVDGSGEEIPSIVLPSKLYAVAGHEFVLYYRNILRAMRPDDFAVTTAFTNGSTLPNLKPLYDGYLRFTPAEAHVGSHTLTIKVFSRRTWDVVATKSVTLVISSDKAITGKKVMYIGDSLTYASVPAAEVQRMSSDGILSIGTISHSISFNGGTAAIKSEGRNSAASYDYVNKQTFAGYDNPFYNPDTEYSLSLDGKYTTGLLNLDNTGSVSVLKHHFDFTHYMATNGGTVGEPDAIFICLGTNGGNKSAYQAVFIAFDAMIERIKAYNADLPVFLHLFPPKSEAGSTDRTAGGTVSGWLNARTWYYDIIQTFIDRYENDSRVTLVPTYTMLDPVYDYKRETVAVSARNTETVTIGQDDGTHPANPGYLHMADSYYNILQALWSGEVVDTYYTVTNNLTNVTNSNTATSVKQGNAYTATLTAASGYTLDTVTVTMGGTAVSVSGGTISISSVTGDIVITATATKDEEPEEPTVENLVDPSKTGSDLTVGADVWVNGYYASSASAADTALTEDTTNNPITTDHIPITDAAKIRIYGLDISKSTYKNRTRMVIGMSDGRVFRGMALPFADTTDGSGATLLDSDGSLVVTVSKFGQAPSWSGKSWARISGVPKDGNNANIIVTVE